MKKDKIQKSLPKGASVEHGIAHLQAHTSFSRRSFIRNLGLTGMGTLLFQNMSLAVPSRMLNKALSLTETDRILVLIRLKGGNDGLNMIVPVYDYANYKNKRNTIAVDESSILSLSDEVGIPDQMTGIKELWEGGQMKVIHSVGYPMQNLSHFRSSDIWATASDADQYLTTGWLANYVLNEYPDYLTAPPEKPAAIQIGGAGGLLFNSPDGFNTAVNVTDPDQLFEIAQNGQLFSLENMPACKYGEQLEYLRNITNSTFIYAETIKDAFDDSSNTSTYAGQLGQQLALVARLIKGNLGAKLYLVTLDGFDTHANQNNIHPLLMKNLSDNVKSFIDDLSSSGHDEKVLTMTYSEFGRRIEQNASGGTDHGAAAPMLMFGKGLNGNGFVGDNPDLNDLDVVGNLKFQTDFRSVYATVLESWLCLDPLVVDDILGQSHDRILNLGLACSATAVHDLNYIPSIVHEARYRNDGTILVYYEIPNNMKVTVEIWSILGQKMSTLFEGTRQAGQYQEIFHLKYGDHAAGQYVYRIIAQGRVFSRSIPVLSLR